MIWKPHATVAAVLEQDGKFLLVEEETSQGVRFNQPAGHLEADESLLDAVAREVLEESAYSFTPQHLLGIYRWHSPESDTTYLRFAFTGAITGHDAARQLDSGILQALWLLPDEIRTMRERHRSPLVLRCIEDYLAGKRLAECLDDPPEANLARLKTGLPSSPAGATACNACVSHAAAMVAPLETRMAGAMAITPSK